MKNPLNQTFKSQLKNDQRFWIYFNMLKNIALSNIGWRGLPLEVDERYVENTLFEQGRILAFEDEIFLMLQYTPNSQVDVYNNPMRFVVNTASGYYNPDLNVTNSVPIFANMTRTPEANILMYYANELTKISKYIDINLDNCSTPAIVTLPQELEFSVKNAIAKRKSGEPVILGKKDFEAVQWEVFGLDASKNYIADKQVQMFEKKWNECLTWLGVANLQIEKKERLISDEVSRAQGGTVASRNARIIARKQGAERVNKMFGLNLEPYFRDESYTEADSPEKTQEINIQTEVEKN